MSEVFVSGLGAVSPAGWTAAALQAAFAGAALPAAQRMERSSWPRPLTVLRVPPASPRPAWAVHPRLRRSAVISQFAMGAAAEALGPGPGGPLGIVFCTTSGCVAYSRRFYDEALRDPATASPLLFPETVFNAPASHLSAVLGSAAANYTLVGDTGVFLHGLALAAGWLQDGRVERCLVVAADELDWITAEVLRRFRKSITLGEGAGAVLLTRERTAESCARLEYVTDPQAFASGGRGARADAARRVTAALPAGPSASADIAQFGESFAASTAWQVLGAIDAARRLALPRATVCAPGLYQEAIGASFTVLSPTTSQ